MRNPIENVSRLQTQLNDLQLENQILKNILDSAGISYQQEICLLYTSDTGTGINYELDFRRLDS